MQQLYLTQTQIHCVFECMLSSFYDFKQMEEDQARDESLSFLNQLRYMTEIESPQLGDREDPSSGSGGMTQL